MRDIFLHLEELKKEMNAVILAHYYQDPYIQDIADFMCDSLAFALETIEPEISIPDDIRIRVLKPMERMLALS
tara:strand:- start:255 stop:473 length:219 start_codon:yes stop_codon:yes gene_type:complete